MTAALPAASGLLLVLCFHPFRLHFLAWLAFIPLLYSLGGASRGARALSSYIFGAAYLGGLLWWIAVVRFPAVIGYILLTLLVPLVFIPWGLLAGRMLRSSPAAAVFGPAALWVCLEILFSYGTFALPWWAVGNSQSRNPAIAQLASFGGIYIISFVVIMANSAIYHLAARPDRRTRPWAAAAAALSVAAVIAGAVILLKYAPPAASRPISIAIAQPNYTQDEKDDPQSFARIFMTHLDMLRETPAGDDAPDIILWSESITFKNWLESGTAANLVNYEIRPRKSLLVTGVYDWDGEESYNAISAIDPLEGITATYRKRQIVPFGEAVPYRKTFEKISPALGQWIKDTIYETDMGRGDKPVIFSHDGHKFAGIICFESVIPWIARETAAKGAEFIFIVTNDAWFKDSPAPQQHVDLATFRAIENRRYVVQAASNGVSAIIDPMGRITDSIPLYKKQTLYGNITPLDIMTFYTRHGDLFAWLCVALSSLFIALTLVPARKKS